MTDLAAFLTARLGEDVRCWHLRIPIRPHADIEVIGDFPVSVADWEQFLAVLEAMKPGLIREEAEPHE